jgi:thiol:disulfide interchange protein DsbA
MGLVKKLLLVLSLSVAAGAAFAGPGNPQNKIDYTTLEKAQPTDSGKRVEVLEFFGYYCPHCYAFDPLLTDWVQKQRDKIDFKRIHVVFRPGAMALFQQMYLTLEVMGKTEDVHSKVFVALHKDRVPLATEEQITDFVVKNGVDRAKYLEVYKSFSIQSKMRSLVGVHDRYSLDSVPTIVIDGRLVTSPEQLRTSIGDQPELALQQATLMVMENLVNQVIKERAGK